MKRPRKKKTLYQSTVAGSWIELGNENDPVCEILEIMFADFYEQQELTNNQGDL